MKKSRKELEKECAKATAKVEQYQHQCQRLENRIRYYTEGERKKRNHRLITRGADVESVVPEVRGMSQSDFRILVEQMLSQSYEAEQKQLEAEVVTLRQEIEVQARQSENIEKFIQTAQKYVSIETLDPYALRELVQAIYVEAPDKSSGKRRQNIHIKYDGLGFIPLDELMKEETA